MCLVATGWTAQPKRCSRILTGVPDPGRRKGKRLRQLFPPKENQTLGKLAKETARDSLVSLSNSLLIISLSIVQIAFTNFLNTVSTVVSNCCFSDQLFVKTTTTTRQPSMLFGAEIKLHPSLLWQTQRLMCDTKRIYLNPQFLLLVAAQL